MSIEASANALRLPCAHGGPVGTGSIRTMPEDFIVREWLGFEPDGDGDHWLLVVRKRGANTHWVAKQLAKLARVHPRDVGFAGLKDRNAVADQAFTVPVRSAMSAWVGTQGDGFEVIGATRHRRKLKRGALKGNDFEITIRDFRADPAELVQRLSLVAIHGVPNYFGPQRFGHGLGNLQRALAMFRGETTIADRVERGFALSAARAALFNSVLEKRVAERTWDALLAGDVANLEGSQSIFAVDSADDVLQHRCATLDIHPTGPLWGAGELRTSGAPRALEESVAAENEALTLGLARAELQQERRALRVRVQGLEHVLEGDVLRLRFRLSRGAFATTVLHELLAGAFEAATPETEE